MNILGKVWEAAEALGDAEAAKDMRASVPHNLISVLLPHATGKEKDDLSEALSWAELP